MRGRSTWQTQEPKPKPKISKVKREMREKFLHLISSGHRSNGACPKCSPPNRASEWARGREGVAMEWGSCDGECDGERRSYAEGVETERGKREKELKVFESFESMRCICSKWNSSLEETSYSWNLFLSQLQMWQSWQKFKCNSSLGETSFNWNSSLLKPSRLHPSIVLKQYDFAK